MDGGADPARMELAAERLPTPVASIMSGSVTHHFFKSVITSLSSFLFLSYSCTTYRTQELR